MLSRNGDIRHFCPGFNLTSIQNSPLSTLAVNFLCIHITSFRKLPFIPCLLINFKKSFACKADLVALDFLSFCLCENVFILLSFFK